MSETLLSPTAAPRVTGRPAPMRIADLAAAMPVPAVLVSQVTRALCGVRGAIPGEVLDLVVCNPAATARVLARRSRRRAPGPVAGVRAAMADISVDELRTAIVDGPTHSLFTVRSGPEGSTWLASAARAVEVARAAGALVAHIPGGTHDDFDAAWTAGLLRDVGRAVAEVAEGHRGDASLPRPSSTGAIAAVDPTFLGARFCARIGLDPRVVDAVGRHADLGAAPDPISRAVWLAVRVVRARTGSDGMDALLDGAQACGIDPTQLALVAIGAQTAPVVPMDLLTPREHDVLILLADGLVPKQIALELGCTVSTVNNHLHHVYGKLGVTGQAHALLVARDRGWV